MPTKADDPGQITATNYGKGPGAADPENEKRPGGCGECTDCGECEADLKLTTLRRQNSLVMRLGTRVQAMLDRQLAEQS